MTDEQVKYMVQRFLTWRLPRDFTPDGGISFDRFRSVPCADGVAATENTPSGTNLFTLDQAQHMVRHMLAGLPLAPVEVVAVSGLSNAAISLADGIARAAKKQGMDAFNIDTDALIALLTEIRKDRGIERKAP